MQKIKKVAAINDLSGRGHCSLGAILPILTVMGIECCPIPTAVLSSQTDGFSDYSFVDLTSSMDKYMAHWQSEKVKLDCIYSGFLGSVKQMQIVESFIDNFKTDEMLILVDPVLGDNGKLYDTMNSEMVQSMKKLVQKANVVTPNYTELLYLLDEKYGVYDESIIKDWIKKLASFGPNIVVVTSVPKDNMLASIIYDKNLDSFEVVLNEYIEAHYPGSGDIFATIVCAMLLKKYSVNEAVKFASNFIKEGITYSLLQNQPYRDGIVLEGVIKNLCLL